VFVRDDLDIAPVQAKLALPGFKPSDYPPLAHSKVRFVGEAIAMGIAATRAEAEDLLALVELDLEELPAVVDVIEARDARRRWCTKAGRTTCSYGANTARRGR
jgi:carbon-monoxide dehydrogenase large subunit